MTSLIPGFIHGVRSTDLIAALLLFVVLRLINNARSPRVRSTKLRGPSSGNFLVGLFPALVMGDPLKAFETWAKEFGSVFNLPMAIGRKEIVVCDVKAVAHILARDTFAYHNPDFTKVFLANMFGKGILSFEDDDHKRLRKALTPAFSNSAVRGYIDVFNDSFDKLRIAWDGLIDSGAETIEVQQWMNNLALENLGVAGFSHHFGTLQVDGKKPDILEVFEAFQSPAGSSTLSKVFFFLGVLFPSFLNVPTENTRLIRSIKYSMKDIADQLLEKTRAEMEGLGDKTAEKSIIGLLIKAESATGGLTMSSEEVLAQMNTLFFPGYETTSTTTTWALIELCKNPDIQEKLRRELDQLGGADPTWEQLTLGLPYLDAVTQETLRMHAPVVNISRTAQRDDVIPLSMPILTADGEMVSELIVAKGKGLHLPIGYINMSEELWGPDVKEFKPERWIDAELYPGANAIQGHRHILSFSDGPRFCLGRHFALANIKSSLANIVRKYSLEFRDGKNTEIGIHAQLLRRPKIVGEDGPRVPLVIRRIE